MKTFTYYIFIISLIQLKLIAQTSNPDCPNGDAENNNFINWATYSSPSTSPQSLNSFYHAYDADRIGIHANTGPSSFCNVGGASPIINAGIDFYSGIIIPNQGVYCFRVGNNKTNAEADLLQYTFIVTQANAHFKFRYAMVMQDGFHVENENSKVHMYMTMGNRVYPNSGGSFMGPYSSLQQFFLYANTVKTVIADVNNPYFKRSNVPGNTNVVYKDWQCVEYDLSQYIGLTLSFNFFSRDCSNGGHWGYAYLDGLCTDWPATASMDLNKTEFCEDGSSVLMNGASSSGEDRYYVEVAECDAGGTSYTPGGALVSQWFLGEQVPNNFNITNFFNSSGNKFKCDKYYKVKLAVINDCATWNETSKIIHFNCPEMNAGNNIVLCCGNGVVNGGTLLLGATNGIIGNSYQWSSYPAGYSSSLAQNTIPMPQNSTAYILTVKDKDGCIGSDSIIVRYQNSELRLTVSKLYYDGYTVCDLKKYFTATVTNADCPNEDPYFIKNYPIVTPNTIKWDFKEQTTNNIIDNGTGNNYAAPNNNGTVITSVTNGCKTITVNNTVQLKEFGDGSYLAPNAFTPNGDNINDLFQILEYGLTAPLQGQGPAYNASDFRLTIVDRWGLILRTVTKASIGRAPAEPLINGDVQWDGRDDGGSDVPTDTYNYILELKYCGNEEWSRVCLPGSSESRICLDGYVIPSIHYGCKNGVMYCVSAINLIR